MMGPWDGTVVYGPMVMVHIVNEAECYVSIVSVVLH